MVGSGTPAVTAATPKLWRRPRGWAWGPVMPARCMSSRTWRAAVPNRRSDSAHEWCDASACTIPTGPCTVAIVIASGMLPSAARQRGYPGYFRMGTPLFGLENRVAGLRTERSRLWRAPVRANISRYASRPEGCRRRCARRRSSLISATCALMTHRLPRVARAIRPSPSRNRIRRSRPPILTQGSTPLTTCRPREP